MARVLIASDQPMVRSALGGLLLGAGHTIVAEAGDARAATVQMRETDPDLVVLDTNLNPLNVLLRARAQRSKVRTVLYGDPSVHYIERCYEAGADAFVGRQDKAEEFNRAVAAVLAGRRYFPDFDDYHHAVAAEGTSGVGDENALSALSDRELTVLRLLVLGHSNVAIANELSISEKTVSVHRSHLRKKLHVESLVEMLDLARKHGLVAANTSMVAGPSGSFTPTTGDVQVLRAMLNGTPFPVHIRDREGRLVACNTAFESVHGVSFEAVNGKRIIDVDWYPEDVAQSIHERYLQRAAVGESIRMDAEVMLHGRRRVLHQWATPFRGESGEVLGMVCGSADITGREDLAKALMMERELAEASATGKRELLQSMRDTIGPLVALQLQQLRAIRDETERPATLALVNKSLDTATTLWHAIQRSNEISLLEPGVSPRVTERANIARLTQEAIAAAVPEANDTETALLFRQEPKIDVIVILDRRRYLATLGSMLRSALVNTRRGRVDVLLNFSGRVGALVEVIVSIAETPETSRTLGVRPLEVPEPLPSDISRRLAESMKGTLRRTISPENHPVTILRLLLAQL